MKSSILHSVPSATAMLAVMVSGGTAEAQSFAAATPTLRVVLALLIRQLRWDLSPMA